jgi:hypothetical protein
MSEGKCVERRDRPAAGAAIPVVLGGSLSATIVCLVILAVAAASDGSFLDGPPQRLLAGFALVGLALPLCVAGLLLRGPSRRQWVRERFVAAMVLSAALLCLAFGLMGIVLAAYPLARLLVGL